MLQDITLFTVVNSGGCLSLDSIEVLEDLTPPNLVLAPIPIWIVSRLPLPFRETALRQMPLTYGLVLEPMSLQISSIFQHQEHIHSP